MKVYKKYKIEKDINPSGRRLLSSPRRRGSTFKEKKIFSLLTGKPSGVSIVEILAVLAISSVVLIGGLRILTISTRTSQVVRTSFSEQDLRIAMGNVLGSSEQCEKNLKPTTATGINNMGIGEVSQITNIGETILQTGGFFKKNLEIIKMELKSDATPLLDPKTQDVTRTFLVYYKKRIVGKQATLGGEECTSTNLEGCYFSQCKVVYKLNAGGTDVDTCDMLDCTGGEKSISCYTVDEIDSPHAPRDGETGDARTLVGCGGTSEIERSTITAFGFGSGASNDPNGTMNTYIGYKAGTSNKDFDNNTFIGYEAGKYVGSILPPTPGSYGYNIFIGTQAGYKDTLGSRNTFVGSKVGYENTEGHDNVFLGTETGYGNTKGGKNVYIGYQAGYSYDDIADAPLADFDSKQNVFIGYQAGKDNTKGYGNTFIGYQAGQGHTEGRDNIYIGNEVKPTGDADITVTGWRQLNIGNLILGRMPPPNNSALDNSPNINPSSVQGVVINGNLKVRGSIEFCTDASALNCPPSGSLTFLSPPFVLSSKEYKKNIKPFKDYEKALEDIINTPLFTYEYKKDRPEKSRMGIISEELPKHLQLKEKVDPRLRGDDGASKDGGSKWKGFSKKKSKKIEKVSMPDWPSIYGTFWAGIKALFIQFKNFKEKMFVELKKLKEEFTNTLKLVKGNKNTIGELSTLLKNTSKVSETNQEQSSQCHQEVVKLQELLKKNTEKLQSAQKEIEQIKELIKKQNQARCSSTFPMFSENNNLHDYEILKKVAFPSRVRQFFHFNTSINLKA